MSTEWKHAKDRYQSIKPPEELDAVVRAALRNGNRAWTRRRALGRGLTTALAGCACFILLVNASPSFARAVSEVPVLGALARVFTVTEYSIQEDERLIDVRLPALENTGHTELEQRINQEITTRIETLISQAEARAQENRDAFIATGGESEEFMPVIIDVDYEIKCQSEQYLSFLITETETQATSYQKLYPYSLDLETGRELTLQDLLGAGWKELVNDSIKEQIAQRSKDSDMVYWDGAEGVEGFSSIREDQPFYLNQAGRPVVLFKQYEIAPGYMGVQEFEIIP